MGGEGKAKTCELPKWISFQKERREPILNGQIGAHEHISLFGAERKNEVRFSGGN